MAAPALWLFLFAPVVSENQRCVASRNMEQNGVWRERLAFSAATPRSEGATRLRCGRAPADQAKLFVIVQHSLN